MPGKKSDAAKSDWLAVVFFFFGPALFSCWVCHTNCPLTSLRSRPRPPTRPHERRRAQEHARAQGQDRMFFFCVCVCRLNKSPPSLLCDANPPNRTHCHTQALGKFHLSASVVMAIVVIAMEAAIAGVFLSQVDIGLDVAPDARLKNDALCQQGQLTTTVADVTTRHTSALPCLVSEHDDPDPADQQRTQLARVPRHLYLCAVFPAVPRPGRGTNPLSVGRSIG